LSIAGIWIRTDDCQVAIDREIEAEMIPTDAIACLHRLLQLPARSGSREHVDRSRRVGVSKICAVKIRRADKQGITGERNTGAKIVIPIR
jgi:hypothetical protein